MFSIHSEITVINFDGTLAYEVIKNTLLQSVMLRIKPIAGNNELIILIYSFQCPLVAWIIWIYDDGIVFEKILLLVGWTRELCVAQPAKVPLENSIDLTTVGTVDSTIRREKTLQSECNDVVRTVLNLPDEK